MSALPITIPADLIAEFCRRNQIRKLSLFGSVLTSRFRPESDVDMLVEFEEDARPALVIGTCSFTSWPACTCWAQLCGRSSIR